MDDHKLLRDYVERRSQDAFRQLVDRHLPMVFSAAHRMVRDAYLAEEVVQNVFTTLAQKAQSVAPPQIIGGWLYNTTRNFSMHAVRSEQRRREREQIAVAMQSLETTSDAPQIAEQLEGVMDQLDPTEREVLVLRFLENRSLRDLGTELGISEDAARMRVNRALEQLRSLFGRQGIHLTSAALGSALFATTVSAVPAGLSASILTAISGTAATTTATHAFFTTMNWINTKTITALLGAAIVGGTGTYLVQQRTINALRAVNQELVAQQKKLAEENEAAMGAAQTHQDELKQLRLATAELPRLRNEVNQLRQQQKQAAALLAKMSAGAKPAPPVTSPNYISKDRVTYAGYSTPEAALQSITWATLHGTPEQMKEGLSPQLLENADAYRNFESGRKQGSPILKGLEILAKKTVSENEVEMKLRVDTQPIPGIPLDAIPMTILPMVKVGNEWKVGTSTRDYDPSWEQSGRIETVGQ
jgi:RNA polymerase sigma factor (sigma-70 family)